MLTRSPYWDYIELEPIRIQFQIDEVDPKALREHLEAQTRGIREAVARGRRGYLIIAAPGDHRPAAEVRKIQAEWMEAHRDEIAASILGVSFVVDSPIVRGALMAIFWVTRPPVPYKVHSSMDEALTYAIAVCRQHDIELPAEALRYDAVQRADLALARALHYRVAL